MDRWLRGDRRVRSVGSKSKGRILCSFKAASSCESFAVSWNVSDPTLSFLYRLTLGDANIAQGIFV